MSGATKSAEADMFVVDLSRQKLTSCRLKEALVRLVGVLEEEEAVCPPKRSYLARCLEVCVAENDVTAVVFPEEEEMRVVVVPEDEKKPQERSSGMMMLLEQRPEEESSRRKKALPSVEDRLVRLDLRGNRLGPDLLRSFGAAAKGLWRLRSLDLSANGLRGSPRGLGTASALEELFLGKNELRDLDGLAPLKKLEILDVSSNLLTFAALRPLSLNVNLKDVDVSRNDVATAAPDAKRAFRAGFPKLRRLRGLDDDHFSLFAPNDRKHDSYGDAHLRRRNLSSSSVVVLTKKKIPTTKKKQLLMQHDAMSSSEEPRPSNDKEQDPPNETRTILRTRYARPTFRGMDALTNNHVSDSLPSEKTIAAPPTVETAKRPPGRRGLRDKKQRNGLSGLPWRQPPHPLPRWMVEQSIGKQAAQTVLRKTTGKHNNLEDRGFNGRTPARHRRDRLTDIDRGVVVSRPPSTVGDADPPAMQNGLPTAKHMPASVLEALEQIVRYQRDNYAQQQRRTSFATDDGEDSSSNTSSSY